MVGILNCQAYCLSFNDEEKKNNMIRRFNQLHIDCNFYEGVQYNDSRIANRNLSSSLLREWSCCYGHLDMIHDFYFKSDKPYGLFCENDIHIHKDFNIIFSKIITDFNLLNLDILLLGYLTPFVVDKKHINFNLKRETRRKPAFSYHNYPDDLQGSQMYILSRKYAKKLIDKYYNNFADKTLYDDNTIFTSDNIITKDGNRALISPVLAVEEKKNQNEYHIKCHESQYKKFFFI
jgi:GR25 family glycosyltransferase involved in LPS biosynthesis